MQKKRSHREEIERSRRLSADQIRLQKNERAHQRNLARKAKKRASAEERQAVRDERSNQEQLAKLDNMGYTAKKERARLIKG